jgi:hypothetical protein
MITLNFLDDVRSFVEAIGYLVIAVTLGVIIMKNT